MKSITCEVENYGMQHLLAMVWDVAHHTGDFNNCLLYLLGCQDTARHTVGWHSELAQELDLLQQIARSWPRNVGNV